MQEKNQTNKNSQLVNFIETQVVAPFYSSRLNSLKNKTLASLVKTKNPYLFRVKNPTIVGEFVKQMLDAFLSSSEETIFGKSLEKLAIYICSQKYNGYKPTEGEFASIDLVFEKLDTIYIVGIKSGSAWGNADSVNKMIENISKGSKALKVENQKKIEMVSGICYGKSQITRHKISKTKTFYSKYYGKEFWELVSGDADFYKTIVIPFGESIKGRDLEYKEEYDNKINEMTQEMFQSFCVDGKINWEKIVQTNSGIVS